MQFNDKIITAGIQLNGQSIETIIKFDSRIADEVNDKWAKKYQVYPYMHTGDDDDYGNMPPDGHIYYTEKIRIPATVYRFDFHFYKHHDLSGGLSMKPAVIKQIAEIIQQIEQEGHMATRHELYEWFFCS